MKTIKAQSNKNLNWEDIQEMQQQKKAHKQFRANRQSRKGFWRSAE